jgi:hypothetical protein
LELALQFIYRDIKLFLDGWLVFDFCIVLMSWSLESLQVVRTFRVFRALRLVTRVRVLKNLVSALFSVGPRSWYDGGAPLLDLSDKGSTHPDKDV